MGAVLVHVSPQRGHLAPQRGRHCAAQNVVYYREATLTQALADLAGAGGRTADDKGRRRVGVQSIVEWQDTGS